MEPDDLLQVNVDGAPYSIHHPTRTTMRSKIAIVPKDLCLSEQNVKIFKDNDFSKVMDEIQAEDQVLVIVTVKDLN